MKNASYAEVLSQCLKDLHKACLDFVNALRNAWHEIKELVKESVAKQDSTDYARNSWYVPSKITMPNQVSSRKPMKCVARSSC